MTTRRNFIQKSALLSGAFAASPVTAPLMSSSAYSMDTSDYKALVCVFLFGGMDCHDTVIPIDATSYNSFASVRAPLLDTYTSAGDSSRLRDSLLALAPSTPQSNGRQFGLPSQMSALHALFNQGRAAIIGNVGPLVEPVTRSDYTNRTASLPRRLFSHNDQQSTWMSFQPEGATIGWGGKFGDAAANANANANPTFSQISMSGQTVFLAGQAVTPFQMSSSGVPQLFLTEKRSGLSASVRESVEQYFAADDIEKINLFERDVVAISNRSIEANKQLTDALESATPLTTSFPQTRLGAQLKTVAETIAQRDQLGAKRQIFFVGLGGFDTHDSQAIKLPQLQQQVSDAIASFYEATIELGVANQVTSFTASDFGRTLSVNGDGTDHGWGAHHFVVGGAVAGGDIYGDIPEPILGHGQDAGNGRLIPTISIEQMVAPLGSWFGLESHELAEALPGLGAFPNGPLVYV